MTLSSLSTQPIDESIIREQVLSTDDYDGRHFNTNFILSNAEKILNLGMGTTEEAIVEKLNQVVELNNIYEQLPCHIRQVSVEIVSGLNAKTTNQQHSTTIGVLRKLCWYSWEDKMVLMLAAFSIIYGEYILLVSPLCKGPKLGLAQMLGSLRQNNLAERPQSYTKKVVVDCLSSVLELTKCVVELKQCPYYSPPPSVILALPMATYWIATILIYINAAFACGAHFKIYQNELGELTALTAKILATFSPELAMKRAEESFQTLRHKLLHHNSSNRAEVFRSIFNAKNDDEKIFRNSHDVWGLNLGISRRTMLLLLTSGFDISNGCIDFLNWFYYHSEPYIIWIPIKENDAPWTTEDEQQFEKLKEKMYNLFWVNDPQKMLPQFTRYVREELFPKYMGWGEEAILVSLDRKGKVVHSNVMHMILTWAYSFIEKNTIGVQRLYNITPLVVKEMKEGTYGVSRVIPEIDKMISDFSHDIGDRINAWTQLVERRIQDVVEQSTPYHSEREKDLWQQETTWSLHLLAPKFESYQLKAIGELISDWIQEEKYIFLYGGNDMKWVQEFTSKVREVGSKTQLNIELVYVGRNKKIRGIIDKERMSHSPLHNSKSVWWFWTRLRSMFLSRIHYLDVTNCPAKEYNNDEILQGVKKLLAYESTNTTIEGWALLSKGAKVIVCGHGTKMLRVMNDYQIWKENIAPKGFGKAFKDHHEMILMKHVMNALAVCTSF